MTTATTTPTATPAARLAAADLRLQAARTELRANTAERALAVQARFDVLDPNTKAPTQRRTPSVELKNEDGQLSDRKKLEGLALVRQVFANSSQARAIHVQFEVNVVGAEGPKVKFHCKKDLAKALSRWFNGTYAKECDALEDMTLQEMLGISLNAVKREGEVLAVFDDFDANDGALLWYEIDQLATIEKTKWKEYALAKDMVETRIATTGDNKGKPEPKLDANGQKTPLIQKSGRVMDRRGKVLFYVVAASERGKATVAPDLCTFIPKASARMLNKKWRFGQVQGQSEALSVVADLADLTALRRAEIASANKNAERAYAVFGEDARDDAYARAGINVDDEIDDNSTDPESGETFANKPTADRLEEYANGYVDYLGVDEKIEELGTNRPNLNVQHLYESVGTGAGAALGVASVFSSLKASNSYTAFRGEMLLSWLKFKWDQKWLERRFLDWLVPKAITWGLATGAIADETQAAAKADPSWASSFSFTWPKMPEVDELKAASAIAKRLKIGAITYADLLGPDWEEILEELGIEVAKIRKLELPLEILETKAGAPAPTETPAPAGKDADDTDDDSEND